MGQRIHWWTGPLLTLLMIAGIGGTRLIAPAGSATAAPADEVTVESQRAIELPGVRQIALSPDGTMIAGARNFGDRAQAELCTFDVETLAEVACASLAGLDSGLRIEDVVWSPDSTKLAFAENAFIFFRDGDIWVMDALTGDLLDLTDEGVRGKLPFLSSEDSDITEFFIDVNPAWSPDSQTIAFSRSAWRDGDWRDNSIVTIPAAGGEIEPVIKVTDALPGIVYFGIDWQADGSQIFYNVNFPDIDDANNGIWVVDRDGSNARMLVGAQNEDLGPAIMVQVAPDGEQMLVHYVYAANATPFKGPFYAILDVASGELTDLVLSDPEAPTGAMISLAAMSPDGSKLLTVTRLTDPDHQVFIQDVPDGDPIQVVESLTGAVSIGNGMIPTWSTNGLVLINTGLEGATLLHLKGSEGAPVIPTSATSGPIASSPIANEPPSTEIAPGATVYTNDDGVRLRAAPSRDAEAVIELDRGAALTVIGASVDDDDLTWWPVIDPATNTIGWVRADLISLTQDN